MSSPSHPRGRRTSRRAFPSATSVGRSAGRVSRWLRITSTIRGPKKIAPAIRATTSSPPPMRWRSASRLVRRRTAARSRRTSRSTTSSSARAHLHPVVKGHLEVPPRQGSRPTVASPDASGPWRLTGRIRGRARPRIQDDLRDRRGRRRPAASVGGSGWHGGRRRRRQAALGAVGRSTIRRRRSRLAELIARLIATRRTHAPDGSYRETFFQCRRSRTNAS